MKVPNLYMIETVDSIKLADLLNSKWKSPEPLKVLVQVNTSQEQGNWNQIYPMESNFNLQLCLSEKSGIPPNECINLYRHISENCKNLALEGLMTIGAFGHDYSIGPNPDFLCLLECHANVCQTFNLSPEKVHISMGMSDDFEQAVSCNPLAHSNENSRFSSLCWIKLNVFKLFGTVTLTISIHQINNTHYFFLLIFSVARRFILDWSGQYNCASRFIYFWTPTEERRRNTFHCLRKKILCYTSLCVTYACLKNNFWLLYENVWQ